METNATQRAFAKLTRTLKVTGVRSDGYHLLESEMVTVDLFDTLQFSPGRGLVIEDRINWVLDNPNERHDLAVPADDSNLVARALALVGAEYHVQLTKRIPPGAGLGGGSADAAAVLRQLRCNDLERASLLGADVPFCIAGGRSMVRGIGEVLDPLEFCDLAFIILTPAIVVPTGAVYARYDQIGPGGGGSRNDLTASALQVEPRLSAWRELLGDATGYDPVLAGSGSSFFVECPVDALERLGALVRERVTTRGEQAVVTPTISVRPTPRPD